MDAPVVKANKFRIFFSFGRECFRDLSLTLFKNIHLIKIIMFLFIFSSKTHGLLQLRFKNAH